MTQSDRKKVHKVGIVGVGGRARLLTKLLRLCEPGNLDKMWRERRGSPTGVDWRAEIVAGGEPSPEMRAEAKKVLPETCRLHDDPIKVIEDPEVEVVIVSTATIAHAEWVVAALEAGKDVICEKPMATSLEALDAIAEAVERTGGLLGLSMQNRFSYWATQVARLLGEGALGEPAMFWCHEFRCEFWTRPATGNWIRKMKESGGPFLEKNSHHYDIFNLWAQSPAKRVFAMNKNTGSHREDGDIFDAAWSQVEYDNGVIANHGLSLFTRHGHNLHMGIVGTGGWCESLRGKDGGHVTYRSNASPEERVFKPNLSGLSALGHAGAEIPMFSHLFDCFERRVQPALDCWWGRESILVGLAAQRSADEGRAVEVDELRRESKFPDRLPEYKPALG